MTARLALVLAFVASSTVFAQGAPGGAPAGPPAEPGRIMGIITTVDNSGMTVKGQSGTETRLTFKPDLKVLSVRPAKPAEIKPGTTAIMVSKPDSNGKQSIFAIRLIEADAITDTASSGPGPVPGSTMTNGKVTKVTNTDAGLELDVAYPGGSHHLLLPSGALVLDTYAIGQGELKVGTRVESQLIRESDGTARTGAIMLMPAGAGPPGTPGAGPPR